MNNKRRARLQEAVSYIEDSLKILYQVKDEEQDGLDNFPENLQNSEQYNSMEEAIDTIEDSINDLEQTVENLGSL